MVFHLETRDKEESNIDKEREEQKHSQRKMSIRKKGLVIFESLISPL
jgi:hypothetical protein